MWNGTSDKVVALIPVLKIGESTLRPLPINIEESIILTSKNLHREVRCLTSIMKPLKFASKQVLKCIHNYSVYVVAIK